MKVEQQQDGTWLAEQTIRGRLCIAEGLTRDAAWIQMDSMLAQKFHEHANAIMELDRIMKVFNSSKTAELNPIIQLAGVPTMSQRISGEGK